MKTNTMIVFTTTCKGRLQHLSKTLPKNMADNAGYQNCKFVVLDYGCTEGTSEYLKRDHAADIESGRLIAYRYNTNSSFNVAHAKNIAARCAILEGADILVTVDADNFTGQNFAQFIADRFAADAAVKPGVFLCPNYQHIKSLPHGPSRPDRGYAGRLAIRAQDFLKMGAYDETGDTFATWRGEDIDLVARLRRAGYVMRHIDNGFLKTIPHGADVRFKEYPHAKQFEHEGETKRIYAQTETVVNFGKFGLGTVYRNCDSTPIELRPVPTRIFGVGMQKTGTTSLHEALSILGLDSFHWGSGEAPIIWQEMNASGRSKTLEQWYALSDMPIPLLYKKLDQSYPGSKFILTIRNETDWLKSVSGLWDYERNRTRWMWDVYPFTNRIHTVMYGQKDFDAKIFLARYKRHNAEVLQYFRDRPNDLLVINMDEPHKWPELCNFLKVPVPDAPYPIKNKTNGCASDNHQECFIESVAACYTEERPTDSNASVIWLTGLPCSGKTTIGSALVHRILAEGKKAKLLDGDEVRKAWPELGYSRPDREENIRRIGEAAEKLAKSGTTAVVSVVSPYRKARNEIRERCESFKEVYVDAPLALCEKRDVKGMYAKAHAGNLPGFTGIDSPYEPPENPEVTCHTDRETVEQCVDKIMGKPVLAKPVEVPAVSSRQEVQEIQVRQGDQKPPMPQRQVQCRPYFIHGRNHHHHHQPQWTVPQLCAVYDWPKNRPGGGTIAIVELGGGWTVSDMEAYFNSIGQPMPQIQDISVDGTQNSQQSPTNDADYEVALDVQVAAAAYYIATGKPAQIRVYWAADIAPAVTAAAKDGCTVCSISWGLDEAGFGTAGCRAMETAAEAATVLGMTIFAAAGDNNSADGGPGPANVDCPSSCPHVIACGGTTKSRSEETVWDNTPGQTNGEGTGGGFSTVFPSQPWQKGAPQAPVHIHGDKHPGMGRMVPDVTACADPNTGYEIIVYGQKAIIGGTSAVAPLYAGLFASFGKKLGFITPELYLNPTAFTDIVSGSNGIFSAAVGVDPVSGLGAPIGTRLAALL